MRRSDLALVLGLTGLQAIVVTGPFLATGSPPGTLALLRAGVVVPFLLILGTWLVARKTALSRTATLYALVVVAFFPPVVSHLRGRELAQDGFGGLYLGVLALPLAATGLAVSLRRAGRSGLVAGSLLAACSLALFAAKPSLAPLLLGLPATATSPLAGSAVHALVLLPLVYAAARGLEAAEGDRGVLRWLVAGFASVGLFALTVFLRSGLAHAAVGGFVAFMAACSALVLASALRLPPRSRARWLGFALLALTLLDVSTAAFWSVRPVLHGSSAVADAIGPTP